MKNNKWIRIAAVLCIVCLLTTCVISGTFAKYVTSGNGSDTARVAKWGVTITANGGAFSEQYKSSDGKISTAYTASTDSVHSGNAQKVIAPGTGDSVVAVAMTGTPEVDFHVEYESTVTLSNWVDANGTDYCPIVFNVNGAEIKMDATNNTVALLAAAVEAAIEATSADYECGTDLSAATTTKPVVSWAWPYSTDAANDVKDTYLGNVAAGLEPGTPATITIAIGITVTQID